MDGEIIFHSSTLLRQLSKEIRRVRAKLFIAGSLQHELHNTISIDKITSEDVLRTSPLLYVTPQDASVAGRPWDVFRTSN